MEDTELKSEKQLYTQFEGAFKRQLGLLLSDAVEFDEATNKLSLKIKLVGLSMSALSLNLTKEQHEDMADFLSMLGSSTKDN